jgi:hypothetical protein
MGQTPADRDDQISLDFVVDGKHTDCPDLDVTIGFENRTIRPERSEHGFHVPALFLKGNKSEQFRQNKKVNIAITCGEYSLSFPEMYPISLSPGSWKAGIARPPFWFDDLSGPSDTILRKAAWLSFLEYECYGCDPGIIVAVSHDDPPVDFVDRLRAEQQHSNDQGSRDTAYSLAVFNSDYQSNRDYLLKILNDICLKKPLTSPEDDVCDGTLISYIANLYWRGDRVLLQPLLEIPHSRESFQEIGQFYAEILDERPSAAIDAIKKLSTDQRQEVCRTAGEDDLSVDSPKLKRVEDQLQQIGSEEALQCEAMVKMGVNHPFGRDNLN